MEKPPPVDERAESTADDQLTPLSPDYLSNSLSRMSAEEVNERDALQNRLISLALEPWVSSELLQQAIDMLEEADQQEP